MSDGKILAYQNNRLAIIDLYGNIADSLFYTDLSQFQQKILSNNYYYNFIIINKKFIDFIYNYEQDIIIYNNYLNYLDRVRNEAQYQKVLDSNNVKIYVKI
jgi:hypothetical protein